MSLTLKNKENYLRVIENSVGTKIFRNLFAEINGEKVDITKDGELSCAYFVSSILYLFKLIKGVHATVDSTIRDLKEWEWIEIEKPELGCVIVWAETNSHKHIGFYIGDEKAISNNFEFGYPTEHDWQFRKVESILWNQTLK